MRMRENQSCMARPRHAKIACYESLHRSLNRLCPQRKVPRCSTVEGRLDGWAATVMDAKPKSLLIVPLAVVGWFLATYLWTGQADLREQMIRGLKGVEINALEADFQTMFGVMGYGKGLA